MTTGESTDNMENVTITSDVAYERVASDEHFEEEKNGGYLQQNTSGLVQEIPNISFLDISDTMLESKKTLYDRENWVLRVGKAGRSIEVQPQDTVSLRMVADYDISSSGEHYIEFDDKVSSLHYTVCKPNQTGNLYEIEILQTGFFTVSYGWEVGTNGASELSITISKNGTDAVMTDRYKDTQLPEIMSGGKHMSNIYLEVGDIINMKIDCDSASKIYKTTFLDIQFQQYTLGYSNI